MAPDPKEYEHLSNEDRMLQGYPYNPLDPLLVNARLRCRKLIREFNAIDDTEEEKRGAVLDQLFNPASGKKKFVEPTFRCDYGRNITVGENFYMNFDCCIVDVCPIKIGKNFMAAPGVHIYSATHPLDVLERREWENGKPVTIGDDVWVGGMAVICPGVTIGNGAVIGAGAVVVKDIPEYVLAAGNPARVIKQLPKPTEEELNKS